MIKLEQQIRLLLETNRCLMKAWTYLKDTGNLLLFAKKLDPEQRNKLKKEGCELKEEVTTFLDRAEELIHQAKKIQEKIDEFSTWEPTQTEKKDEFLKQAGEFFKDAGVFLRETGDFIREMGEFVEETGEFIEEAGEFIENAEEFLKKTEEILHDEEELPTEAESTSKKE